MLGISGLLFLVAAAPVQAPGADKLLSQADRAMADYREVEAFSLYGQVLERDPADLKALVGASWLAGKLSTYTPPGDEKTEYTLKALSLAEQAYALAPNHPEVNLVMAWANGGKALISGIQEKVQRGLEMKAYLDLAVAGHPDDPRGWYLLGRWCRRIASASVLERAGARMAGATLPDHISLKDSRDALTRAVELDQKSILYRWELAQVLLDLSDEDAAIDHLKAGSRLKPKTPQDPGLQARLRYRLSQLSN